MPITVLVADDYELMRKTVVRLLVDDSEIKVVAEASSFSQMMKLVTDLRPDVVVMDLHMGSERDVTPAQVKSTLVGSRLLAISIWQDDKSKFLAESFGAVTLLGKGNLATELIPAIKQEWK